MQKCDFIKGENFAKFSLQSWELSYELWLQFEFTFDRSNKLSNKRELKLGHKFVRVKIELEIENSLVFKIISLSSVKSCKIIKLKFELILHLNLHLILHLNLHLEQVNKHLNLIDDLIVKNRVWNSIRNID